MGTVRVISLSDPGRTWEAELLETWGGRMRGLLGTDEGARPVLLERCGAVHTVGMRYGIDVAFVDSCGVVRAVYRDVRPGRLVSCRRASRTLERPASGEPWPEEGERLLIACVGAGDGDDA